MRWGSSALFGAANHDDDGAAALLIGCLPRKGVSSRLCKQGVTIHLLPCLAPLQVREMEELVRQSQRYSTTLQAYNTRWDWSNTQPA